MKPLSYLAILLLTITTLNAQEVKLKKDIVSVDGTAAFSYTKKSMGNELYVYKLNTSEELLYMVVENNNTESKVDDSKRIVFTKQNVTIKSKDFRGRNFESLIKDLLQSKAINLNGEINTENLIRFRQKYDDGNINHVNKY